VPVVEGGTVIGVLSFHDVAKAVLDAQTFENRMLKGYITDSVA
jgi:CBS domain-containing protein